MALTRIKASNITDGTVVAAEIADDAIVADKIATNAVTDTKIAANAVTDTKIANNAVTDAKISAVAASKLTGTIATARLGTGASGTTFLRGDSTYAAAGSTSASDLTSGTLPMARLTGTLPTLNGSALTNLPLQMEEDYWSLDMSSATGTTVHTLTANFTPQLAWMTYNPNASIIGMVTGWMDNSGGTAGSQNNNNGGGGSGNTGKYWQGNGMLQCASTGGAQYIDMTASAPGQYTITNTHAGGSISGTGYFSLILFGN